jgi:hypothetical protein
MVSSKKKIHIAISATMSKEHPKNNKTDDKTIFIINTLPPT